MTSDTAGPRAATACIVQEGDTVVWAVNREKQSFLHVKAGGFVRLGNAHCRLDPIIGTPYGSVFTVADATRTLQQVSRSDAADWAVVEATDRNNAKLLDDAANQALVQADIDRLKGSGASGGEILAALEAASSTFASKTEFSQEKYRRKKARKYLAYATVIRPTARSICEAYFSKTPAKVCNLRVDTLAIMLSQANVQAQARVLVLEMCGGLITGAVAERLGGFGVVCSLYTGRSPPSQDAVRMFNFPWAMRDSLCCASLERLSAAADSDGSPHQQAGGSVTASQIANGSVTAPEASLAAAVPGQVEAVASPVPMSVDATQPPYAPIPVEQADVAAADAGDGRNGEHRELQRGGILADVQGADVPLAPIATAAEHPEATAPASECGQNGSEVPAGGRLPRNMEPKRCITAVPPARFEQLRALVQPGFDSCLIAAPTLQPLAAVQRLLPFLAPSAFFVVFSPFMQPLAEAMAALQASKAATNLQLQESWWRESQVLPCRTHPEMSTTGTGGYLLSGIKLVVQSSDPPAAKQSRLNGEAAKPPAVFAGPEHALPQPAAVGAAQAEEPPIKKQKLEDSSAETQLEIKQTSTDCQES